MVLATTIVVWRRFDPPGQLAAYLGLVRREASSGSRERRGSITKAGNSHCRHVLVQGAWCYHYRPHLSVEIRQGQVGQPPAVIAHAWQAQMAVVAVVRELVGFLWAVMQDCPVSMETAVA